MGRPGSEGGQKACNGTRRIPPSPRSSSETTSLPPPLPLPATGALSQRLQRGGKRAHKVCQLEHITLKALCMMRRVRWPGAAG